jgi:hypothetical protein
MLSSRGRRAAADSPPGAGTAAGQRLVVILVGTQGEGVEAAALQVEQLVAQHVANRAQLAAVAVALAQQARGGVAAAVAEFGEVHSDDGEIVEVVGDRLRSRVGGEPYAERRAVLVLAGDQFGAARAPHRDGHQQGADRQPHGLGCFVFGEAQDFPVILDHGLLLDDVRHLRPSFPVGGSNKHGP